MSCMAGGVGRVCVRTEPTSLDADRIVGFCICPIGSIPIALFLSDWGFGRAFYPSADRVLTTILTLLLSLDLSSVSFALGAAVHGTVTRGIPVAWAAVAFGDGPIVSTFAIETCGQTLPQ